jgi:predicted nucleic acid-binding protein
MEAFWDTSALLPLVLEEIDSPRAAQAWAESDRCIAWNWLQVEAESALLRRKAPKEAWRRLDQLCGVIEWIDIPANHHPGLCEFNRTLALRSADAAHLYAFATARGSLQDLTLVSFDNEMKRAALRLRLAVWKG